MRRCGVAVDRRVAAAAIVLAGLALVGSGSTAAAGATTASLRGKVVAAGNPLVGAEVTLYAGSRTGAEQLGDATTDAAGAFTIAYSPPASGVLYVAATGKDADRLRLLTVAGFAGGGVPPRTVSTVTVNELTTVAATYALAQFVDGDDISGPSPGLENAAATTFNLVDPASGAAGSVVTNANNGSSNDTLATLGTLADLVAVCSVSPTGAGCSSLLKLATPPGGTAPANTAEAVLNLAKNPLLSRVGLYELSHSEGLYTPALAAPPEAWMLALLYTDTDLYASGRVALDASGNVWSGNNWQPGTQNSSTAATALDPVGEPVFGSPISGGGIDGVGWGTAVGPDSSVWFSNFGGNTMTRLSSTGKPLSPSAGWTNGGLDDPQGVAVDQKGNVWIANSFGPESAPDQGDVVVYPGGDPSKAFTITGGGLNHPFAIQIDGRGDAWVTNAGLGGAELVGTRAAPLIGKFGGSVTVIGPDFKPTPFSPIESNSFMFPLGLALDSKGNAWVTSFFGHTETEIAPDGTVSGTFAVPGRSFLWADAVDGSDRVWVSGFSIPGVWLLCGENTAACPPGSATGDLLSPKTGFRSKALQHLTSVQIDESGNVWLSNNWTTIKPPTGGTGVVELIGMATPVCTPLIGQPQKPSAATGTACPGVQAASGGGTSPWIWLAVAAGTLAVAAGIGLLVARGFKRT